MDDFEDFLNNTTSFKPVESNLQISNNSDLDFLNVNSPNDNADSENSNANSVVKSQSDAHEVTLSQELDFLSTSPHKDTTTGIEHSTKKTNDDLDFLSSPTKNNPVVSLDTKVQVDEGEFMTWLDKDAAVSNPIKKNIMDDFFDEVFGDDGPKSTFSTEIVDRGLEDEINTILSSSFPDVENLKITLQKAGYVPRRCRGKVWNLILTGGTAEDEEAEFWHPTERETDSIPQIQIDCSDVVDRASHSIQAPPSIDQAETDIRDILLLYCVRRKADYDSMLCHQLVPMILSPYPFSRAIASSCFYAFCSAFTAYITLQPQNYDRAVFKVHSWMRLLLWYHFPVLAKHLDNVHSKWELPNVTDAEEARGFQNQKVASDGLDLLERDLGLSEASSPSDTVPTQESNSPTENIHNGFFPKGWISSLFGASIPPMQTCWLWDWMILSGDRTLVTLLGLYSEALVNMNSQDVSKWISRVRTGSTDWYNALPINGSASDSKPLTWESFTRGWLHACVALRQSTPKSFCDALLETEEWATEAFDEKNASDRSLDNSSNELDRSSGMNAKLQKAKAAVKRFSTKIVGKSNGVKSNNFNDDGYCQDTKTDVCSIWSSVEEVIPCICSTQRNKSTSVDTDMCKRFEVGAKWSSDKAVSKDSSSSSTKGGEGMSFPSLEGAAEPFFFGIDIRNDIEIKLGKFPKAFSLNPHSLSHEYDMGLFMDTLEPLKEVAHLCIIGVGEEYVRCCVEDGITTAYTNENMNNILGTTEKRHYSSVMQEAMAEYKRLVNETALFFMRKGFKYISVLDGGFASAARYLIRDDSPFTLATALVDVNPLYLDQLLGAGTCDNHLATRRQHHHSGNESNSIHEGYRESSGQHRDDGIGGLAMGLLGNITPAVGTFMASIGSLSNKSLPSNSSSAPGNSSTEEQTTGTKQVLEDFGKKISIFGSSTFASLKKSVAVVGAAAQSSSNTPKSEPVVTSSSGGTWRSVGGEEHSRPTPQFASASQPTFVIDEDDDELNDADHARPEVDTEPAHTKHVQESKKSFIDQIPDTDKVAISRTDAEKNQALAMHKLSGLRKGDKMVISRDNLPGALLFPATKQKVYQDESGNPVYEARMDEATGKTEQQPVMHVVHRYLVVTRERFIVLDSGGKGVGSEAVVKSNHHLTELLKITFKKKSPDVVTLFLSSPGSTGSEGEKTRQYRVTKRKEFVEVLQKNMMRFK